MSEDRGARACRRSGKGLVDAAGEEALADSRLQLTYQAFCATHERAWSGIARIRIGDPTDADLVVQTMKAHLRRQWTIALRQRVPAAYAWRLLMEHIGSWLEDSQQTVVQADIFKLVIDRSKELCRQSLENLPEQIGLYTAILALPDRQRDSVILRYVLDLDDHLIAEYLDRPVSTVRSNLRHARERLAKTLAKPMAEPQEDDR